MDEVSLADKFRFDTQGYILLKGVLSSSQCRLFIETTDHLADQQYEDAWLSSPLVEGKGSPTLEVTNDGTRTRLNGLIRLDSVFDQLIDLAAVLRYLQAFMEYPQLINTWSIRKTRGEGWGGWHRGIPQTGYSYHNGKINSRMINVITFLTDTSEEDGCLAVIPGSHKANLDLNISTDYPGDKAPGHVLVPGEAGDVLVFSEALLHNGSPKATSTPRTNLYFNYIEASYNPAMRELIQGGIGNFHHYWLPPEIRRRFTPAQKELTQWMDWMKWEHVEALSV